MDSLRAMELKGALEASLGAPVPISSLLDETRHRPAGGGAAPGGVPGGRRRTRVRPEPAQGASCRCPSRRSGSGSWTGCSRGARRTTCAGALRLRGAVDAGALARSPGGDRAAPRGAAHRLRRGGRPAPCSGCCPLRPCRCRWWTCRALGAGGRAKPRRGARRRRWRGRPSTWRRGRCSARGCCGWAPTSTCWCWRCTTSSATGGRPGCWSASWARSTRRCSPGARSPCRRCRRSTPTGRCGSARRCAARRWRRSSPAGASACAGLAPLPLPTDRPRPPVQSFRGATHRFEVPAEVMEGVRALARAEGATLFMALLAAWDVLLARYAGEGDVAVGTPVSSRDRAGGGRAGGAVRQHAGAAGGGGAGGGLPRAAGAGARGRAGSLRAPGPALRAAGGGGAARARPEPRTRSSR